MTTQQLQAAISRNQARVVDLLQWDMEQYGQFLYQQGLEYLNNYLQDQQSQFKLEGRVEFWNWWRNLWNARDEEFIQAWDGCEWGIAPQQLRHTYQLIHSPAILACEIKPPAVVYGKDFTKIEMAQS